MDINNVLEFLAILMSVASVLGMGIFGWFTTRRKNSGKIATSEASVLWQQSQAMRQELQRLKERAEDERDRLMESYQNQIVPSMASISKSLTALTESISEVLMILRSTGPLPSGKDTDR